MKAICLASLMTVVLFLGVTLAFRLAPSAHRVRRMTAIYGICGVILTVLWLASPDDLGILPRSWLVAPAWFDLVLALFFFSAAYFGGVLQLYNLADRGFSLRMLIDALESPDGAIDVDRVLASYSAGQGMRWMYDKRMHGMLEQEVVHRAGGSIVLTAKGERAADLFIAIRNFLRLDDRP